MLLPTHQEHKAEAVANAWEQGVATEIESLVQFALDTITLNEIFDVENVRDVYPQ